MLTNYISDIHLAPSFFLSHPKQMRQFLEFLIFLVLSIQSNLSNNKSTILLIASWNYNIFHPTEKLSLYVSIAQTILNVTKNIDTIIIESQWNPLAKQPKRREVTTTHFNWKLSLGREDKLS